MTTEDALAEVRLRVDKCLENEISNAEPENRELDMALELCGLLRLGMVDEARHLCRRLPPTAAAMTTPTSMSTSTLLSGLAEVTRGMMTHDFPRVFASLQTLHDTVPPNLLPNQEIPALTTEYRRNVAKTLRCYRTLSVGKASRYLGLADDEATDYLLQKGWTPKKNKDSISTTNNDNTVVYLQPPPPEMVSPSEPVTNVTDTAVVDYKKFQALTSQLKFLEKQRLNF